MIQSFLIYNIIIPRNLYIPNFHNGFIPAGLVNVWNNNEAI